MKIINKFDLKEIKEELLELTSCVKMEPIDKKGIFYFNFDFLFFLPCPAFAIISMAMIISIFTNNDVFLYALGVLFLLTLIIFMMHGITSYMTSKRNYKILQEKISRAKTLHDVVDIIDLIYSNYTGDKNVKRKHQLKHTLGDFVDMSDNINHYLDLTENNIINVKLKRKKMGAHLTIKFDLENPSTHVVSKKKIQVHAKQNTTVQEPYLLFQNWERDIYYIEPYVQDTEENQGDIGRIQRQDVYDTPIL